MKAAEINCELPEQSLCGTEPDCLVPRAVICTHTVQASGRCKMPAPEEQGEWI